MGGGQATTITWKFRGLAGTFMIRQLQPWHENIKKRQVKAPKIYFLDSGLLHGLLGLPDWASLVAHPRVGASLEGFVLEQLFRTINPPEGYFWATHTGAEIDLLFVVKGKRYGVEIMFNEAPTATRSMRIALEDLRLQHMWIIYPGEHSPNRQKDTHLAYQ